MVDKKFGTHQLKDAAGACHGGRGCGIVSPMSEGSREITVYTDGACQGNPGPGGYGIVVIDGGHRRELSGGFRKTTNNRMELFSVIRALKEIRDPGTKVTIYSDAQYVVNMFNGGYARQWRENGWTRNRGKYPAMNPDLWGDLLDICDQHEVTFVWVRGHANNRENSRCDELAVAARLAGGLPADEVYEKTGGAPLAMAVAPEPKTEPVMMAAAAVAAVPQQLTLFDLV